MEEIAEENKMPSSI